MISLKDNYDKKTLEAIRELYEEAFPACEKKPFDMITDRCKLGLMEILAVQDGEELVGLAITAHAGDIVLLDYFAIMPHKRGEGVGTEALKLLQKRYMGMRFILEIEDDSIPADNTADRIRRKSFYLRCGMEIMPYRVLLFGVEMLILTYGGAVAYEEYHGLLTSAFSPKVSRNIRLLP